MTLQTRLNSSWQRKWWHADFTLHCSGQVSLAVAEFFTHQAQSRTIAWSGAQGQTAAISHYSSHVGGQCAFESMWSSALAPKRKAALLAFSESAPIGVAWPHSWRGPARALSLVGLEPAGYIRTLPTLLVFHQQRALCSAPVVHHKWESGRIMSLKS